MTLQRRPQTAGHTLTTDLLVAMMAALAGSAWLSWLHASDGARPGDAIAVVNESATIFGFTLPLVMLAVPALLAALRRRDVPPSSITAVTAAAGASAIAVSAGSQLRLFFGHYSGGVVRPVPLLTDAATVFALLLVVGMTVSALAQLRANAVRRMTRTGLVLVIGLTGSLSAAFTTIAPVTAGATTASCLAGGAVDKTFDVTALDVNIPINRFGDHDPKGKMYALTSQLSAIPAEAALQKVSIGLGDDPIQPLAIRANEGDCVEIHFTNHATGGDYGMHIDGLEYTETSSGDRIGANPSSAVPTGQSTTYRYAGPVDPRLAGRAHLAPGPPEAGGRALHPPRPRQPARGKPRPVRSPRRRASRLHLLGRQHRRTAP